MPITIVASLDGWSQMCEEQQVPAGVFKSSKRKLWLAWQIIVDVRDKGGGVRRGEGGGTRREGERDDCVLPTSVSCVI